MPPGSCKCTCICLVRSADLRSASEPSGRARRPSGGVRRTDPSIALEPRISVGTRAQGAVPGLMECPEQLVDLLPSGRCQVPLCEGAAVCSVAGCCDHVRP